MRRLSKTLFSLITALCFASAVGSVQAGTDKPVVVSARDFIGGFTTNPKTEIVAATQQRSFVVSVDKAADVFNKAQAVVLTDFPIAPRVDGVVELQRSRPIVDGETVYYINGKKTDQSLPSVQTFRGTIQGEKHSRVLVTLVNGNMIGAVEHEDGRRYILSPATADKKEAREHILYAESAVVHAPEDRQFTCLTPDDVTPDTHSGGKASSERTLSTELLEFNLAIETDYKLLQRFNFDLDRMNEYVLSLLAMVSSIYEDEINVTFHIGHYFPWTEEDPYQANGDIGVMLGKFSQYWRNQRGGIQRTIAHLITGPGSTQVGGIAYRDQLCDNSSGFSVSGIHANAKYPTLDYTWDVNVIAHELGHNFKSHHTHVCGVWGSQPLDTCVSNQPWPGSGGYAPDACYNMQPRRPAQTSIMSYCHLIGDGTVDLTFTPPVAQVIREGAESAKCIKAPTKPTIVMQNPLGNQVFSVGMKVDIRWTSARVNMVGIEYSADNGQTWTTIEEAVVATQRKYDWTIPAIASNEMLIRVYDVANRTSVNDVSMAVFQVRQPTISIAYPVGGERFAAGNEITVKWDKVLVETVTIEFSADNGATWTELQTGVSGKEFKWMVPPVATAGAILRVRDEANNEVISQSGAFTIGTASIQVLAPAAGTEWLVGSQQEIRWQADFVDMVRIEYSTDGTTWTRIGPLFLNASLGSYTWEVPNKLSTNALIRIRAIGATEVETISNPFIITNVVSVNDQPAIAGGTFSIAPQPAGDNITIRYTLAAPTSQVRILIQDVTGRAVTEVRPQHSGIGEQRVEMQTASLTQGVYFVTIEADGTVMTRPLTIMR